MRWAIAAVSAFTFTAVGAFAAEVIDGPAAIKRAQDVCHKTPLDFPGEWQSKYIKNDQLGDEWHVWLGQGAKEPQCGFVGAHVKVDGSTTCQESICNKLSRGPIRTFP